MQLPDSFYEPDEFGTRSYVELGFMSCTADLHVAMAYSGVRSMKPVPSVIVVDIGAVDRPFVLSDFSQCVLSSVC